MASKRAEIERIELAAPERLINRELSWLDFNARVLDLADDQDLPLLERVRFCSIFSSNLDEFFMVRVAGLLRQAAAGIGVRSADGRTSQVVLSDIRERVIELSLRQSQVWMVDLRKALDAAEDLHRSGRRAGRGRAVRAVGDVRARGVSGSDAAGRRAGPAVPVHLRAIAQPGRARP